MIYTHLSATCNCQQHIATFPVSFSTNHLWFLGVDWGHLPTSHYNDSHNSHLHLSFQPSFKVQRKQCPSCSMISPYAFSLSLPHCWASFHGPIFCHTQKNHPFIWVPVSHLQLMKGHFHLIVFWLWNLSLLSVLPLPQSVTLSKCSRAVLKHVTPHSGNAL